MGVLFFFLVLNSSVLEVWSYRTWKIGSGICWVCVICLDLGFSLSLNLICFFFFFLIMLEFYDLDDWIWV